MIDSKTAKMAINTIKAYCAGKRCANCAVSKACSLANKAFTLFAEYPLVGTFEDCQKPSQKNPKFDGSLQLSPDFKSYLTNVLDRALADEGIDSQDLVKHGELAVKIKANGLIKVGAQRDGHIKILGTAKCHPDDVFNLETGVRLAVHRMVQDADKPFEQTAGYVYYFVDYDGDIIGKPWEDDVIDSCNLALDNCFNSTFAAWLHITAVKRGLQHLAVALRLTLPDPKKDGD